MSDRVRPGHTRTHVSLPSALIEAIDALVTSRQRSAFLAEAAAEKLTRLRRQAQRRAQSRPTSAAHPDPETAPRTSGESKAPADEAGELAERRDSARRRFDTLWGR